MLQRALSRILNLFYRSNMERTADNKDLVSMVYEVSGFDQSDSFKFIIKDINGKDFVATLVRATK